MKTLFKDLLIYEVVLLGLGILMFMVLIAVLVIFVTKDKKISGLLLFFPLPIIMIGYPSIQGIEIANDRIKIAKNTEKLIENPDDSAAWKEASVAVERIEKRANTTKDFVNLSKTSLVLGNPEKASEYADRALQKDPNLQTAKDLKNLAVLNKAMENKDTLTVRSLEKAEVSEELRPVKKYLRRQRLTENTRK